MKLEIKHIAPYLPYGLKFEHVEYDYSDKVNHNIAKMESLSADCITFEDCSDYYFDADNCDGYNPTVVPILRPMYDLYKKIDGVVGIVELIHILCGADISDIKNARVVNNGDNYTVSYQSLVEKDVWLSSQLEYNNDSWSFYWEGDLISFNQLELFEHLFFHHYDIYGLIDKGLAIDINSLNNGKSL